MTRAVTVLLGLALYGLGFVALGNANGCYEATQGSGCYGHGPLVQICALFIIVGAGLVSVAVWEGR